MRLKNQSFKAFISNKFCIKEEKLIEKRGIIRVFQPVLRQLFTELFENVMNNMFRINLMIRNIPEVLQLDKRLKTTGCKMVKIQTSSSNVRKSILKEKSYKPILFEHEDVW